MLGEVGGVVAARVDVKIGPDMAGGEDFVEGRGAGFKTKIVLVSAIEIDLQSGEICFARKGMGLFCSQKAGSGGSPKTPPSTRERGDCGERAPRKFGSLSISAALCALTEEKSSGWRNARCKAP